LHTFGFFFLSYSIYVCFPMYACGRCGNRKSNHVDYKRVHLTIEKKNYCRLNRPIIKNLYKSNNVDDALTWILAIEIIIRMIMVIKITLEWLSLSVIWLTVLIIFCFFCYFHKYNRLFLNLLANRFDFVKVDLIFCEKSHQLLKWNNTQNNAMCWCMKNNNISSYITRSLFLSGTDHNFITMLSL
jgi:hypothetical protein